MPCQYHQKTGNQRSLSTRSAAFSKVLIRSQCNTYQHRIQRTSSLCRHASIHSSDYTVGTSPEERNECSLHHP